MAIFNSYVSHYQRVPYPTNKWTLPWVGGLKTTQSPNGWWLNGILLTIKHMGVSENVVYPFLPNGFADHYPVFKWLFVWEYSLFSDKAIFKNHSVPWFSHWNPCEKNPLHRPWKRLTDPHPQAQASRGRGCTQDHLRRMVEVLHYKHLSRCGRTYIGPQKIQKTVSDCNFCQLI